MNRRLAFTTLAACAAAALITACSTPPDGLDRSLQHASAQGHFIVRLEPPAAPIALQRIHAWQLHVSTPDGTPVTQARIGVDGGMPQHGHGYPTQPRVTRETAPGTYTLDGMKFSMTGWWDLRLAITANGAADTAVFNLVLDAHGLQR